MFMQDNGVIAAISTPLAVGGIAVIRLSGTGVLEVVEKFFALNSGKKISEQPSWTAGFGLIIAPEKMKFYNCKTCKNSDRENYTGIIDEGIATVFRNPKSYTGEDVVEISCHGGVLVARQVLEAALDSGARLAEPGEFTKRALLNGKLSLTQAESVIDIINASTDQARRAAMAVRQGRLAQRLQGIIDPLMDLSAACAAWNDFPDEDLPQLSTESLSAQLKFLIESSAKMISEYDQGRVFREGVKTAIIGSPNVGKSTLMNLLAGVERSIVTAVPGTTRDVISEKIKLGNCLLDLSDTAGVRETIDPVESIGVERTVAEAKSAQLIILVLDASNPIVPSNEIYSILMSRKSQIIILWNKCDLISGVSECKDGNLDVLKNKLPAQLQEVSQIAFSAKNGSGVEDLQNCIEGIFISNDFQPDVGIIANTRQLYQLKEAHQALVQTLEALESEFSFDILSVLLDDALSALLELSGAKLSSEIMDHVFANFCVGK